MKLISILLRKTILDYSWIGFPGGSDGKASACNAGDLGSILGSGRSPEDPPPVLLPGKSHGQRSLVGYSPWGHRVGHDWTTSLHFTFTVELRRFLHFRCTAKWVNHSYTHAHSFFTLLAHIVHDRELRRVLCALQEVLVVRSPTRVWLYGARGPQHTRPPCPSPEVCPSSRPSVLHRVVCVYQSQSPHYPW